MNARISILVALVALVLACSGRPELPPPIEPLTRTPEAPFRLEPPIVPEQAELRVPAFAEARLDNGLSLLWVERADLPSLALSFVSRAAGERHAPAHPGLPVLVGDMLLRGTFVEGGRVVPRLHVDRRLPTVGTTMMHTQLSIEVLGESFEEATALLSAAVQRPAFAPAELERQRHAQLEVLRDESRRVDGMLRMLAARLRFGATDRLSMLPSGDFERVSRYQPAELRRFHQTAYRPESSALVAVGALRGDRLRALAEQHFGPWQPAEPPPPARAEAASPPPPQGPFTIHAIQGGGDQTHVLVATPGPPRASPDFDACALLSYVLGRLFESRGNQALRHATGASYGALLELEALGDRGELYFTASVDSARAGDAVRAMLHELERVGREPVAARELEAARARYLAELRQALATNAGTAQLLIELFVHGLPTDYLAGLEKRVEALDAERLRAAARKYLDPARARVLVYTDLRRTRQALETLAPVASYKLE